MAIVVTGPALAELGLVEEFDWLAESLETRIELLMARGLTREQAIHELRWVRVT